MGMTAAAIGAVKILFRAVWHGFAWKGYMDLRVVNGVAEYRRRRFFIEQTLW